MAQDDRGRLHSGQARPSPHRHSEQAQTVLPFCFVILSTDMPQCGAPGRWTNRDWGTVSLVSRSLVFSVGYATCFHVMQCLLVESRRNLPPTVILRRRSRRRIWAGETSISVSSCPVFPARNLVGKRGDKWWQVYPSPPPRSFAERRWRTTQDDIG